MATERISMRKIREIMRLKWELGLSNRAAARSVGQSAGAVAATLRRAQKAGLSDWASASVLDEEELERLVYGRPIHESSRPEPDCAWMHRERSRPGVTLQLLHEEYLERHPNGYQYTAFCERYREFLTRRRLSMRQVHVYGDKMCVDYSGKKPVVVDPTTGEVTEVELFIAVLGASNYTYAEATRTQRVEDFLCSHVRAFAFFGGVPRALVPDNLKSAVTNANRYEPEAHRGYQHLSEHYGTAIVPARPHRPRDKAKVEVGVQIAQRWILGRLRDRVFTSLAELNEAILEHIALLNDRTMRTYGKSRKELFESFERPALRALPQDPFEPVTWKKAKVNLDYHLAFEGRFYSVPYRYVHEEVWIAATAKTVEIQHRGRRIALHSRHGSTPHSTEKEHMPSAHRAHAEWTPRRILSWAQSVGPHTRALCEAILNDRPHPEQGFRSCLGILRLAKRYGDERVELAAEKAMRVGARSYRHLESMLKRGLEATALSSDSASYSLRHENLRGSDYYVH